MLNNVSAGVCGLNTFPLWSPSSFVMWVVRKVRTVYFVLVVFLIALALISMTVLQPPENTAWNYMVSTESRQAVLHRQAPTGSKAKYGHAEIDDFIQDLKYRYNETEIADGNSTHPVFALNDTEDYSVFLRRLNKLVEKGPPLKAYTNYTGTSPWEMFYRGINQNYLYNPDSGDDLRNLLKELSFKPVAHSVEYKLGSQLKLLLTFSDGGQGLFKPMRFSRQLESSSESFFFEDIERHTAEIAAFHVDRVLGLHRSPPVAGRWLNVTSDVLKAGDSDVSRRVFQSPEGNMCFSGTCQRFCQGQFAACGRPVLLEGSVSAFLPYNTASRRKREKHPFRRSYAKHVKWEMKEQFCEADLKTREVYKGGRKLLDLMDMAIFDFIIGNLDRHHYERFEEFGEKGFVLYYDHGRGFAQWQHDCAACKTPIKQCCLIRLTTLAKLVKLYQGPDSLSHVMRTSMRSDPLSPILGETHLDALDRRVGVLLRLVAGCVARAGNFNTVIVDDTHR